MCFILNKAKLTAERKMINALIYAYILLCSRNHMTAEARERFKSWGGKVLSWYGQIIAFFIIASQATKIKL